MNLRSVTFGETTADCSHCLVRRSKALIATSKSQEKTSLHSTICPLYGRQSPTLGAMLGPLRLRQIVLLHIGTEDPATLVETLSEEFGSWGVNQAIRHLFLLNNALCSDELREQFRAIFNNGMCKF